MADTTTTTIEPRRHDWTEGEGGDYCARCGRIAEHYSSLGVGCDGDAPGCTRAGGCDVDPCPVCGCSIDSGWTCKMHREPE